MIITVDDKKIAPAICYESLLPVHAESAAIGRAEIYIASVAKPVNGVNKAYAHYPAIAKEHSMIVLMSNSVGYCDNFESVGNSAVWDRNGELVSKLNETDEGGLVFDTRTGEVIYI